MATSRLKNEIITNFGTSFGSPRYMSKVRNGIRNGTIKIDQNIIMNENQRLDILAGQIYGDSKYWWIIAIASNIGWTLQVPAGTIISIPNLSDILVNI